MEKVIYINSRGEEVVFGNARPFILEKITGLGSPGIDSVTTKSIGDGTYFHKNFLDERIITIDLGIFGNSKKDMYKIRENLVSIMNPKLEGTLIYKNSYLTRKINCRVFSGPNYSLKIKRMQKMQIQFICPDPMFKDLIETNEIMATVIPSFQFPLEIPVKAGVEFGLIQSNPIKNIRNDGDVDSGFIVEFKANGKVVNPSLLNIYTREYIKVYIELNDGQTLRVNTNFNNKKVELIDDIGNIQNVFKHIDVNMNFFRLSLGDNYLKYDAEVGIENLYVNLSYDNNYWGC